MMLKPKQQQIAKTDIERIKSLLNSGMSYRKIAENTGWSVFTISRVKSGFYDKERQCQTIDTNPLEGEVLKLQSENDKLKKELSIMEMRYRISLQEIDKLERTNEELQKKSSENEQPKRSFGVQKRERIDIQLNESHSFTQKS